VLRAVSCRFRRPALAIMPAPPFYPLMTTPEERDAVSVVLPKKLYLTNWRGAEDKEKLKALGVTHVAAVGSEFVNDDEGFHYWKQDIGDNDDEREEMSKSMVDGAAFCDRAIKGGGCVLVHCAAGMSRSVTVVLAYLLLHTNRTLREAFHLVHGSRPGIWPNDGFMAALIDKELAHRKTSTLTLDDYVAWGDYEPTETEEAPVMPRLLRLETKVSSSERARFRGAQSTSSIASLATQESMESTISESDAVRIPGDRRGSINREELKALKIAETEAAEQARSSQASAS